MAADGDDADVLTAERMLELARPRAALPSPGGARFAQASSSYSFSEARTDRSIHVAPTNTSSVAPGEPALSHLVSLECACLAAPP